MQLKKVGFIGIGIMGSALATAARKVLDPDDVIIYDRTLDKCQSLANEIKCKIAHSPQEIVDSAHYIILSVQPDQVIPLLNQLLPTFQSHYKKGEQRIIACIAAGCDLCIFDQLFQSVQIDMPVIRIMPNIPLRVGKGVLIFARNQVATDEDVYGLMDNFREGGLCEYADEKTLLAATPVFGCSPAYVYMFIEALADGGSEIGLNRDMSIRLAAMATLGSAAMVLESGLHVAQLRDELATPGGMTITSTNEMERMGFRGALIQGVLTAYKRSLDMT